MKARDYILFYLNGERIEVRDPISQMMLADFLRYERGLTGTKIVCAEGDCGACTLLRRFCGAGGSKQLESINSCILTVAQMDGSEIYTVEALGQKNLDPVQEAMVKCHGSQCGYCTPGFVMALKGLAEKKCGPLEEKEVKNALTGNLCRCTGYKQIMDAALSVPPQKSKALADEKIASLLKKELKIPVHLETESFSFFAPTSLKAATAYLAKYKDARIVGGGTDLGVSVNKKMANYPHLLSLHLIPDLYEIKKEKSRLKVGARVTLSSLRRATESTFPKFCNYLDIFASPQIKNVATLVGNIANGSPIGDTLPLLLVMNADLTIAGAGKTRTLALSDFYLGYRKTALKTGEVIAYVTFDLPSKDDNLYLFKSSQRKDLDISAINGAVRFASDQVRVAFGGVAPTPVRLKKVEAHLLSNRTDKKTVSKSIELLNSEIHPISDLRGSATMRRILAENFLRQALEDKC